MTRMKELQNHIEMVRESLTSIIEAKKDLLDPEIVSISQLLDILLNEYIRLCNIMENRK